MANSGTQYYGERTTDVRLESLLTTLQAQLQLVENQVGTLTPELAAVKSTAQLALESARRFDAGVMVMIGQNNEILSLMRDVRTVLVRHHGLPRR